MEIEINTNDILSGKLCPYCGNPTEYTDSTAVYSKSYGMIYLCRNCEAWVGVHDGTDKALGRLANKELRELKKSAHSHFDPLWKDLVSFGYTIHEARKFCYSWLSKQMQIPFELTHIGMFDEIQCTRVAELSTELLSLGGALALVSAQNRLPKQIKIHNILQATKHRDYLLRVRDQIQKIASEFQLEVRYPAATQIRITSTQKKIDIYPVNRKYHDLTKNQGGDYHNLDGFLKSFFGTIDVSGDDA